MKILQNLLTRLYIKSVKQETALLDQSLKFKDDLEAFIWLENNRMNSSCYETINF